MDYFGSSNYIGLHSMQHFSSVDGMRIDKLNLNAFRLFFGIEAYSQKGCLGSARTEQIGMDLKLQEDIFAYL